MLKNNSQMFMMSKHVQFGYEAFCLTPFQCHLFQFNVYIVKSSNPTNDMGLRYNAVPSLRETVLEPLNYTVLFDNLFMSYKLRYPFTEKSFYAKGSVQVNTYSQL